jgi:hypothetical protein
MENTPKNLAEIDEEIKNLSDSIEAGKKEDAALLEMLEGMNAPEEQVNKLRKSMGLEEKKREEAKKIEEVRAEAENIFVNDEEDERNRNLFFKLHKSGLREDELEDIDG